MAGIDFTNDEAVVRAAVPDVMSSTKDHCSFAQAKSYMRGAYDEKVWKAIRESSPAVQEFERANNPAFALPSAADLDAHAEEQRVREETGEAPLRKADLCSRFNDYGCGCGWCHDCGWSKDEHAFPLPALPVAQEDAFEAWWPDMALRLSDMDEERVCFSIHSLMRECWLASSAHMGREGR